LLTQASAILGQGQLSLAKYLWITDAPPDSGLEIHDVAAFLAYVLERVDWSRDLHFQTRTTIDTLDYSGDGLNAGSKLVVAATGRPRRSLKSQIDRDLDLPGAWRKPRLAMPGVLCIEAPEATRSADHASDRRAWQRVCDTLPPTHPLCDYPLVVLVDDAEFATAKFDNFIWTTFTRSNPAADVYGVGAETVDKHFGVQGSLVIDARSKPHHAPPLIEDPAVSSRVDALAARGLPISRYL
jgi:4-hydroxy-3-polyprenylbenzoate decarboxylase